MHGNERGPAQILRRLRDGAPSTASTCGWCRSTTPTASPRGTRKNAHGVDLNRNYPYHWADLDGNYESGPRPASEPETRAMMRFLRDVRPDVGPQLPPAAARRRHRHQAPGVLAPGGRARSTCRRKRFDCGGVCHGTMTMWFNHHFDGLRAHRRVRRAPAAAQPDAGQVAPAPGARRSRRRRDARLTAVGSARRLPRLSDPRRPASPWPRTPRRRRGGRRWRR